MNKTEFVAAVAEKLQSSKTDASKAIDAIFAQMKVILKDGGQFRYPSFGTFKLRDRKAREVRNPQNGKKIHVPASKTPVFVASKDLKESVNS